MILRCHTCHWIDEVEGEPDLCGRCLSPDVEVLPDEALFDLREQRLIAYCEACKRFHSH